jgi:predicted nucleic acid-binding protein
VTAVPPFGGGIFIADTSAWTRTDRLPPEAADEWERALINDQIATCPPITLEVLYSTRNPADYDTWAAKLAALRRVATINLDANWALVEGYREIAHQGGHRGVPFADLMAAAPRPPITTACSTTTATSTGSLACWHLRSRVGGSPRRAVSTRCRLSGSDVHASASV